MSKHIVVKSMEDDAEVHRIDVSDKSERQVERALMGMTMNLDHDRFYVTTTAGNS